jgi:hypothetical protein
VGSRERGRLPVVAAEVAVAVVDSAEEVGLRATRKETVGAAAVESQGRTNGRARSHTGG